MMCLEQMVFISCLFGVIFFYIICPSAEKLWNKSITFELYYLTNKNLSSKDETKQTKSNVGDSSRAPLHDINKGNGMENKSNGVLVAGLLSCSKINASHCATGQLGIAAAVAAQGKGTGNRKVRGNSDLCLLSSRGDGSFCRCVHGQELV